MPVFARGGKAGDAVFVRGGRFGVCSEDLRGGREGMMGVLDFIDGSTLKSFICGAGNTAGWLPIALEVAEALLWRGGLFAEARLTSGAGLLLGGGGGGAFAFFAVMDCS